MQVCYGDGFSFPRENKRTAMWRKIPHKIRAKSLDFLPKVNPSGVGYYFIDQDDIFCKRIYFLKENENGKMF